MERLWKLLDSRFVSRVGSMKTLVGMISAGGALLGVVVLVGAGIVNASGWLALVCFGIWAVLSVLMVLGWVLRRDRALLASPAARLAISANLPGATGATTKALHVADAQGREFIATAAIMNPVNNQRSAAELAESYMAYQAELAALVQRSRLFDERWLMLWSRRPSWVPEHAFSPPFSGAKLEVLVRYMALQTRKVGWMIEFLESGNDKHVRSALIWAAVNSEPEGFVQRQAATERR